MLYRGIEDRCPNQILGVQEEFLGKATFEWSFERQDGQLNKWKSLLCRENSMYEDIEA